MRSLLPALLFSAAVCSGAPAQQLLPAPVLAPGNALLTVNAEGKSLRMPDVAMFSAGVMTQGATAAAALAANSTAMARVVDRLRGAGIAERDIQTSNLAIEPVYSDPDRNAALAARQSRQVYTPSADAVPRIVAYRASNQVSVRQRDLKNFGRVIDTLVAAGANQVNGPSFTLDNPNPAMNEARADALRQARERAVMLASGAGLRVIRILSITDGGGYSAPPVVFAQRGIAGAPPPPAPPAPIQPGELQMTANMTILFELGAD